MGRVTAGVYLSLPLFGMGEKKEAKGAGREKTEPIVDLFAFK